MKINREFLEKPPIWFQLLAAGFPSLYWLLIWAIGGTGSLPGILLFSAGFVVMPVSFIVLVVICRPFRILSPVIFFVWLITGFTFSGLTQGAISASISKAYSSVRAQTEALKEIENWESTPHGR